MKILISPESSGEAAAIVDTGVDIIDVKNVREGSLGAQFPWVTRKVVELAAAHGVRTSATLGDLPYKPGTAALAAYGAAATGVSYVKAGLHGATDYHQARDVMDAVRQAVRMVSQTADVVAAGYADYRRFGGLQPPDLVRAARDARCDVVMVDTAIKDGSTLFDCMPVAELEDFVGAARQAGLAVALAGSISLAHAELLFTIGPDIVGVRGAVCEGADRGTRISPAKTRQLVGVFHRTSEILRR